jgi:hypothetical protein
MEIFFRPRMDALHLLDPRQKRIEIAFQRLAAAFGTGSLAQQQARAVTMAANADREVREYGHTAIVAQAMPASRHCSPMPGAYLVRDATGQAFAYRRDSLRV